MDNIMITKRSGKQEPIDLEKVHRVLDWSSKGLEVSVSQVEMNAQLAFFNGMKTEDIQETIIKSSADLISEENPDYQYMSARLAIYQIRKLAYGEYEPPHLYKHLKSKTNDGLYDSELLKKYSEDEISD